MHFCMAVSHRPRPRFIISTSLFSQFRFLMGGNDHCAVLGCRNDRRYPERYVIKEHVKILRFHKCKEKYFPFWTKLLQREDFQVKASTKVCSNHFRYGEPFPVDPHPTLFLQGYGDIDEVSARRLSKKRKASTAPSALVKKTRTASSQLCGIELKPEDTNPMLALEHDHCYTSNSSDNRAVTFSWEYVSHLEGGLEKLHNHCDNLRSGLFAAETRVNKT